MPPCEEGTVMWLAAGPRPWLFLLVPLLMGAVTSAPHQRRARQPSGRSP